MALTTVASLDAALEILARKKFAWATAPLETKIAYLLQARKGVAEVSRDWVDVAAAAKGISGPQVGEEWLGGVYPVLLMINALVETLDALAAGRSPLTGFKTRMQGSQASVEVFPHDVYDRLFYLGYSTEVRMSSGIDLGDLPETVAVAYRRPRPAVVAVLGAGNVASIPALDLLYRMFVEGHVVVLKLNPVNSYLEPFFSRAFRALIDDGYLVLIQGGAEQGQRLVRHELVDEVHLTGSDRTFDAIVFGSGVDGARRKLAGQPLMDKPISAELGGVAPTVIVPGRWREADLQFQAEHLVTQRFQNAGFNCLATQVVVVPEDWPLVDALLAKIEEVVNGLPPRPAYYPGAEERIEAACQGRKGRTMQGGWRIIEGNEESYRTEFFAPVLATTRLAGGDPGDFLRSAVDFCNTTLSGTLGANLLVDPATAAALGPELDQAVSDLRYGTVAVNGWTGMGFVLPRAAWGAYPGHRVSDIQSGTGFVHNALMFSAAEKTVTQGSFRPTPRSFRPPWFLTHRRADVVGERLCAFEARRSLGRAASVATAALRP